MAEALYLPDGDRFVPTVATTGPWDRNAQHGGPSSALLARALERVPSDDPMLVTRLTFDLLRPVIGVDRSYLQTAIDLMKERYGSIDGYMREGLELDGERLEALRGRLLVG